MTTSLTTGSLVSKALWLARTRPLQVYGTARGYLLFLLTQALRGLVWGPGSGVELGENVRVQRLVCLTAERPDARVRVGQDTIIYENARLDAYGRGEISVGESSVLGDIRIASRSRVRIGSRVVTSWNVFVQDFDSHPADPALRGIQIANICRGFRPAFGGVAPKADLAWEFPVAPIEIGNDVWIGANVTILKGARIGDGSIVAASAVVTGGEYPPRALLAGNPAKVVKIL